MNRVLALTLGIVTALGGFVDIGELVFAGQAGARFGYELLWPVLAGGLTIIVYSEMVGRVAIVTRKPVFVLIRERLGYSLGFCVLMASTLVNVLTCAAEVGGVAVILRLLTGLPYGLWVAGTVLALILIVSVLPFEPLERAFGLLGLLMVVFVASAFVLGIDWGQAMAGLVPSAPAAGINPISYAYFAVGLLAGTVMPYEVQFYASGNIEEGKTKHELFDNAAVAIVGLLFGAVVTAAIVINAAEALRPAGIIPENIGTTMSAPLQALGGIGLVAALLGGMFAIGGAAVETNLAGAYGIAQFLRIQWGKARSPWHVPAFTLLWLAIFGLALVVLVTGVDPVQVTEYAVIFSVVVLPLTYLPIFLIARDRSLMGPHANGRIRNAIGLVFLALIAIVAVAAVPLMYLSRMGQA